ncbi:MAG: 3-phosphoserine/phosphohydroxythreonine transaminase [Gammaproteobacteria bacterium]|nr:3-phosphoserine/phosphohydroxythreonine transaminase [Gammaproteobacteria bacterium]
MTRHGFYFGAGPATLPESILRDAQKELLDWQHTDLSILELGHRTDVFINLLETARADLRELLHIPANYQVLFLGGATRTQFGMVPMNLMTPDKKRAGYICTGLWSRLAFEEAKRLSDAYQITDGRPEENTAYVYYTPNETVDGVRFSGIPDVGDVPLVADMTSCLLSEPIDVAQFGLIFAGAQKNIGPAGLTIVIIRDDLLQITPEHVLPAMLDYRVHAKNHSLYATPPVFQCDMAAKMFKWVKAEGGVEALYQINQAKAAKLYDYIDTSKHYVCQVEEPLRSIMNVCFSMVDKTREAAFLDAAEAHGLKGLKGHRVQGGLRASLYNAMPMAGVDALIAFMDEFV